MTSCPPPHLLEQFLAEQLLEPETAAVSAHVDQCPGCQDQLNRLTRAATPVWLPHARQDPAPNEQAAAEFLRQLKLEVPRLPVRDAASAQTAKIDTAPNLNLGEATVEWNWPVIPGYEILSLLGRGAMGIVYRARHLALKRVVAVKMILAGPLAASHEVRRFRTEAEALARLQHPNIVTVFEIGAVGASPFFAMEYVSGPNLGKVIAGGPQPIPQAITWVEVLARAMDHAHQHGIVHRDLKPSNVVLTGDGTPKITDFGLARRLEEGADQTGSGAVGGTARYMAPEQAEGRTQDIGPLSDVYSLGAILYELLTGRAPFKHDNVMETLRQVCHEEPERPRRLNPALDGELEAICLKCLEKDPRRRYRSAAALADDLARWRRREPTLARPWLWPRRARRFLHRHGVACVAILALGVATAAVASALYRQNQPAENLTRPAAPNDCSITLIGDSGPPAQHRWRIRVGNPTTDLAPNGTFRAQHRSYGLLELLDHCEWETLRFRAEIRHDQDFGHSASAVGLYFGHRLSLPPESLHRYYYVAFNDRSATTAHTVWLRAIRHTPAVTVSRGVLLDQLPRADLREFNNDTEPHLGRWRRIQVELTRTQFRLDWENHHWEVPLANIAQQMQKFGERHRDSVTVESWLDFRHGLGLFVKMGEASFRNVVVEPVP